MTALAHHLSVFRDAWAAENRRSRSLTRVEEVEFLPAALEIVERPVSPTARTTARVLLAGLAATVAWLYFGRVDVVASASGKVAPTESVKVVQPADAGVVRAIHVREGTPVRRGQVLVELDPTVSGAEEAQAAKALMAAELDIARNRALLRALAGGAGPFVAPADTPPEVAATQAALVASQLAEVGARTSGLAAARDRALAERAAAAREFEKLNETLPSLDQQIEAYRGLLAKGFAPKLKVVELERQRQLTAGDRDVARSRMAGAAAEIARAQEGLAQGRQEARRAILVDLARAEAEAILRREELTKARQRNRLQRLVAPVDGTVQQLQVHTLGGVVEAAKPVMTIVPSGGGLVVEARMLNKDVGFVRPGQEVAVKLEAFPFTKYGTVPGTIEHVATDAVADEHLGLVYPIRVKLARGSVEADGRTVPLSAGMSVTADIRTGRRRLAEYLLSPVARVTSEAGRER